MQNNMKAVILHANQDIRVDHIPLQFLEANVCRVKISYVGICSSDIQRGFDKGAYSYPLIMGHEISGIIVAVGDNVKNCKIGDHVAIFPLIPCFECDSCKQQVYQCCSKYSYYGSRQAGGYCEYIDVNPWNLLHLPKEVALSDAAAIEPLSVVIHALRRVQLLSSSKVKNLAIIGAGFLGLLMAQVLCKKMPSICVTMVDKNKSKLDVARLFCDNTVLLENDDDWKYCIKSTHNFDMVVEASGVPAMFARTIELALPNSNILWLGNISGDLLLPKKLVSMILRKELHIIGTWNSSYKNQGQDDWQYAIELIKEGITPSSFVTHWINLDDVPRVLRQLYLHKTREQYFDSIKVMVANG